MKEFAGKTAVVTGAAHGIGLAIGKACAARGMNVVLADIDREALAMAEKAVRAAGAPRTLAVYCDVTRYECLQELAQQAVAAFGTVELLVNNAGVTALGDVINTPLRDFDFCIKTNLYSVFYGLKTFVPILRGQNKQSHIVVTASAASFSSTPGMPTYHASKYGLLGLCEPVYYDFLTWGDPIGMTILCPAMVKTDIDTCDDRRPQQFAPDPKDPYYSGPVYKAGRQASTNDISGGMEPEEVAERLFGSIERDELYCVTEPELLEYADFRLDVIRGKKEYDVAMFHEFMKHDGNWRKEGKA